MDKKKYGKYRPYTIASLLLLLSVPILRKVNMKKCSHSFLVVITYSVSLVTSTKLALARDLGTKRNYRIKIGIFSNTDRLFFRHVSIVPEPELISEIFRRAC